ncbi:MAG: hypothetical protein V8S32_02285 [Lachnospiraceae bacterium]
MGEVSSQIMAFSNGDVESLYDPTRTVLHRAAHFVGEEKAAETGG